MSSSHLLLYGLEWSILLFSFQVCIAEARRSFAQLGGPLPGLLMKLWLSTVCSLSYWNKLRVLKKRNRKNGQFNVWDKRSLVLLHSQLNLLFDNFHSHTPRLSNRDVLPMVYYKMDNKAINEVACCFCFCFVMYQEISWTEHLTVEFSMPLESSWQGGVHRLCFMAFGPMVWKL